jgi:hypothetical protein
LPLAEVTCLALALATLGLGIRMYALDKRRSQRVPGFNAATVVDPLEYTFRPHVDLDGIIKEPNDRQIADYMAGVKKLTKAIQEKLPAALVNPETDITEMFNAVEELDPEIVVEFHDGMAGIFAALCSGTPSKKQILQVPIRVRVMFYGWLQNEVMSPEAASGAGTAANVTKLPARAG